MFDLRLIYPVWQHVQLSEQTRPLDTLACSWDAKQASKQPTKIEGYRPDRLVGLVVQASASGVEAPEFESRLRRDFFPGSSHTSDFKIGTPVATLPGAWRCRVSCHGVSIL